MEKFVFYTGLADILFGFALIYPEFYYNVLDITFCSVILGWFVSLFTIYTGITIILTSRDLLKRASYLYYTAWLKFLVAFILIPVAIKVNLHTGLIIIGSYQMIVAFFYLVGMKYFCELDCCDVRCDKFVKGK